MHWILIDILFISVEIMQILNAFYEFQQNYFYSYISPNLKQDTLIFDISLTNSFIAFSIKGRHVLIHRNGHNQLKFQNVQPFGRLKRLGS